MKKIRLAEIRKTQGYTQKQMCELLDISIRVYQDWEYGKIDLNTDTIKKICDIFNCSADYLLGLSDQCPPFWYKLVEDAKEKGIDQSQLEAEIRKFLDL